MELLILRHGQAQDHGHPQGDFARNLIEKGHLQAQKVARLLTQTNMLPNLVLSSPVTRAHQTATTFCQHAQLPDPIVQPWLACGMHPETAIEELAAYREFSRIMIVGHEPDLSQLLCHVLATRAPLIDIKKASLSCVELFPPHHHGLLRFLIPPKFIL